MVEIALHVLDIAENSVTAGAKRVEIDVEEDTSADRLRLVIEDDGQGMDPEMLTQAVDPFTTTRSTRRVGLGLSFLKEAAERCNGHLTVESTPGRGTRVIAEFQRSHIDRAPLGDLAGTFLTLLIGFSDIRWIFHYRVDDQEFSFDSEPIRRGLGDIRFTDPVVLGFLRRTLEEGVARVQSRQMSKLQVH
ncbi:MAG: ATP-binding protein [Candidatus Hadarchaeum sp.]